LRQRGNDYVERDQKGATPVLKFQYAMIADARTFTKPVNYALVSIVPPAGVDGGQGRFWSPALPAVDPPKVLKAGFPNWRRDLVERLNEAR